MGSLLSSDSVPIRLLERLHISDKLEHALAYVVLAFLPAIHERRNLLIGAAAGAVVLGVLLEYGQAFAGRDFEIGDMVADAAGVALGLVCALPLRSLVMRSSELPTVMTPQD
jgi:VanZ family protein